MPLGAATYLTNTQRRTHVVTDNTKRDAIRGDPACCRPSDGAYQVSQVSWDGSALSVVLLRMRTTNGGPVTLQHIPDAIRPATPPTMTVEDAAKLLGISRTMAYTEAARYRATDGCHGLPNIRLGGRVLVLTAPLLDMVWTGSSAVRGVTDQME